MKNKFHWIIALAALGVVATVAGARAQTPMPAGPPVGLPPAPCCDDGCGKVCRAVTENRKVITRVYCSEREDFCLPKCSVFGSLFGGKGCGECGECGACGECGRMRKKKYLIVKLKPHEECVIKCVAESACTPACTPGLAPASVPPAPVPVKP